MFNYDGGYCAGPWYDCPCRIFWRYCRSTETLACIWHLSGVYYFDVHKLWTPGHWYSDTTWLLVWQQVEFKLAFLVHKAPNSLASQIHNISTRNCHELLSTPIVRQLFPRVPSSEHVHVLTIMHSLSLVHDSLPAHIRQPDLTSGEFYRSMKTRLVQHPVTDAFTALTWIFLHTYLPFLTISVKSIRTLSVTLLAWCFLIRLLMQLKINAHCRAMDPTIHVIGINPAYKSN